MRFPSLKEITDKAQNAFKRFPITLIWAILGSFYVIYIIGLDSGQAFDDNLNIILTLILGISWLIGTQFLSEQQKNPQKWIWAKGAVLVLLFLFYWHLPYVDTVEDNPKYFIRFFLYLIGGHLFVLFAPFIRDWDKAAYWNYLKSVGTAIGRSLFFSGVLYLGLVLALVAIDALFEVRIAGERYGQLFIFCLGVVNTWIYLSDFPKNILGNKEIHFDKALEVFVKYILIPLVLLYLVILYAYGIKILLEWELPKGWVSYLVTALALLGFVVQVIINPVQKSAKAWTIHRFHPWFYYAMLPLTVLLFIAIFRRVADYGITENRYFVLLIAVWIFAMSIYLLFFKNRRLILLPISLFGLALMSSFGFWGAFTISRNSQIGQFEKVFKNVTANGKKATAAQFEQLRSIIDYLEERESLFGLNAITGLSMDEIAKDTTTNNGWKTYGSLDTSKILDSLGISLSPDATENNLYGTYFSYYDDQNKIRNYDIGQFSYFSPIYFGRYGKKKSEIGKFDVVFDANKSSLTLFSKKGNVEILQIPFREKIEDLSKFGDQLYKVDEQEMVLESENDSIFIRLIFTELGFNIKNDSIDLHNVHTFMFLKEK